MALAIIAALPVESRFVPSCLETLVDKKVAGIALNLLERLVDWICSWIYCPYYNLYKEKMARVHLFNDQVTPLFDSTKEGIANIEYEWVNDSITLRDRRVCFNPIPHLEVVFSRMNFTDYVVIQDDDRRRPGWVKIIEQELPRPSNPKPMEKYWVVNTNELHQFQGEDPVYLAEQPA